MRDQPAGLFWNRSLAIYSAPGVEAACLALEERHGLDVNMLLLCLWLGERGIQLDQRGVGRLMAAAKPWHDQVVVPLRAMRQRLKRPVGAVPADAAEALRQRVKALELDAERLTQEALMTAIPSVANAAVGVETAGRNLAIWARVGGFSWQEWDWSDVGWLLAAAFPEAPDETVQAILTNLAPPQSAAASC